MANKKKENKKVVESTNEPVNNVFKEYSDDSTPIQNYYGNDVVVKDLIELLSHFDPDTPISVSGTDDIVVQYDNTKGDLNLVGKINEDTAVDDDTESVDKDTECTNCEHKNSRTPALLIGIVGRDHNEESLNQTLDKIAKISYNNSYNFFVKSGETLNKTDIMNLVSEFIDDDETITSMEHNPCHLIANGVCDHSDIFNIKTSDEEIL